MKLPNISINWPIALGLVAGLFIFTFLVMPVTGKVKTEIQSRMAPAGEK